MKKSIAIHHLEDEPELFRWIGSTLLNRYWSSHPDWVREEGRFEEEEYPKVSSFELIVGDDVYTVQHRFYESPGELQSQVEHIESTDVVLLDLSMGRQDEMPGLQLYSVAVERVGRDRVYVFSAFPQVALDEGIPMDHFIQKPPDPTSLIDMLVDVLAIGR